MPDISAIVLSVCAWLQRTLHKRSVSYQKTHRQGQGQPPPGGRFTPLLVGRSGLRLAKALSACSQEGDDRSLTQYMSFAQVLLLAAVS